MAKKETEKYQFIFTENESKKEARKKRREEGLANKKRKNKLKEWE